MSTTLGIRWGAAHWGWYQTGQSAMLLSTPVPADWLPRTCAGVAVGYSTATAGSNHAGPLIFGLIPHVIGSFFGMLLLSIACWRPGTFPKPPLVLLIVFLLWEFYSRFGLGHSKLICFCSARWSGSVLASRSAHMACLARLRTTPPSTRIEPPCSTPQGEDVAEPRREQAHERSSEEGN
jgi:hypothetical protein